MGDISRLNYIFDTWITLLASFSLKLGEIGTIFDGFLYFGEITRFSLIFTAI